MGRNSLQVYRIMTTHLEGKFVMFAKGKERIEVDWQLQKVKDVGARACVLMWKRTHACTCVLYICMYVCVFLYFHVFECMCLLVRTCVRASGKLVCLLLFKCTFVWARVCVFVFMGLCVFPWGLCLLAVLHMNVCEGVCICIYLRVFWCAYIYSYVFVCLWHNASLFNKTLVNEGMKISSWISSDLSGKVRMAKGINGVWYVAMGEHVDAIISSA